MWVQIVSQVEASGEVAVQELADIQGQSFDSPRVLVSNQIGGMEDIPVSFSAVCNLHLLYTTLQQKLRIANCIPVRLQDDVTAFLSHGPSSKHKTATSDCVGLCCYRRM